MTSIILCGTNLSRNKYSQINSSAMHYTNSFTTDKKPEFKVFHPNVAWCNTCLGTRLSALKRRENASLSCRIRATIRHCNSYTGTTPTVMIRIIGTPPVLSDSFLPLIHSLTGNIFWNFSTFNFIDISFIKDTSISKSAN